MKCECADPGCNACNGLCTNLAKTTLFRIDMDDYTGIDLCDECTEDAMESGLFSLQPRH